MSRLALIKKKLKLLTLQALNIMFYSIKLALFKNLIFKFSKSYFILIFYLLIYFPLNKDEQFFLVIILIKLLIYTSLSFIY